MDAYQVLRRMKFSKAMNESVKRAVRVRLEAILEEHERRMQFWEDHSKHHLTATRQKEVRRNLQKIHVALKITIWHLTPIEERSYDPPIFFERKK